MFCRALKLTIGILVFALPLSPIELSAFIAKESETLTNEIETLQAQRDQLPENSLNLSPWTMGYLSNRFPEPTGELTIEIDFETIAPVDLVVLMPSTYTENGSELEVFCFPERFMLERIMADGSTEVFADYRDTTYAIDGFEPQFFEIDDPAPTKGLRLTVTQFARNHTWRSGDFRVSLDELMAFAGNCNVALNQSVTATSEHRYSYVISSEALVDGFSLFSPVKRNPDNPNRVPLRLKGKDRFSVTFDLGREVEVDEFRFWPLVHGLQFNFPPAAGLGFPRGILIETATSSDFLDAQIVFEQSEVYPAAGSNPLMLRTVPQVARYVRMTLDNAVHDYRTNADELILDEIQIFSKGDLLTDFQTVSSDSIEIDDSKLSKLTDGKTTEGDILPLRPWLVQFAERAELDRTLHHLQNQLEAERQNETRKMTQLTTVGVGLVIALTLMVILAYLLSERRWNLFRARIASDIHDDLGANMISVAHTTELVRHDIKDPSDRQIRLLETATRTAYQTAEEARQIVNLLEYDQRGRSWVETLNNALSSILVDHEYELIVKDRRVFNQMKPAQAWDLLLFLKESVNNVVKHADATNIQVQLSASGRRLIAKVQDNGRGLENETRPIRHLQMRADRLGGTLTIESSPSGGVVVRLEI